MAHAHEINFSIRSEGLTALSELDAHAHQTLDCRNWEIRPYWESEPLLVDSHEHKFWVSTHGADAVNARPLPLVATPENSNTRSWNRV